MVVVVVGGVFRIVGNVLIAIQKLHIVKHFAFYPIKEYRPSDKCDNSSLKMSWVTNDNSVH